MIYNLIKQGESKTVEFKMKFPQNNQIAQTVCAFANRAGGYILLGVNDSGEIIGLDDNEINEYSEKIPNIISDSIFPMILPEIYSYRINNKSVLVVQIYPGSSTPYHIREKGKLKGTYIRVGRTNKNADEEIIKELERQRINKSYDEEIYEETRQNEIVNLCEILGKAFNCEITEEKLINLKLIEEIGQEKYLTNAGAIILGKMANSIVKCARFYGESVIDFIDKKEYSGNVFYNLENTIIFLKNHLFLSGIIRGSGLTRKDVLEIPEEILREGILNAITHRNYSMSGADIKVAVFDSKIEITSPGGLPKSLTVEEIYAGRSEIRNRVLSNVFLKAELIEQWGSGIPRIREIAKLNGLREPEIEEKGLFVVLRIFRKKNKIADNDIYKVESKTKSMIIEEEKNTIYNLIAKDRKVTVQEIADKMKITPASAQRRLHSMQEENKIYRKGSKKTGYWQLYGQE